MKLNATAWVPDDDPERDWSVAAGWAAHWVNERCSEEDASGVLVTNTLDCLGVPELDDFERRHVRTSPRAGRDRVGSGTGPVLSYVPGPRELEFATRLARGSCLAVVEGSLFPLGGWAAWFGAWNLVNEAPTPPLPADLKKAVERLAFYGNNGLGDDFGKRQARSILGDVGDHRDVLLSAVLAAGVSARGIENLSKLLDKM